VCLITFLQNTAWLHAVNLTNAVHLLPAGKHAVLIHALCKPLPGFNSPCKLLLGHIRSCTLLHGAMLPCRLPPSAAAAAWLHLILQVAACSHVRLQAAAWFQLLLQGAASALCPRKPLPGCKTSGKPLPNCPPPFHTTTSPTCLYGALPVAATLVSSEDWNQPGAAAAGRQARSSSIARCQQRAGRGRRKLTALASLQPNTTRVPATARDHHITLCGTCLQHHHKQLSTQERLCMLVFTPYCA
jgi:hypothetical protein